MCLSDVVGIGLFVFCLVYCLGLLVLIVFSLVFVWMEDECVYLLFVIGVLVVMFVVVGGWLSICSKLLIYLVVGIGLLLLFVGVLIEMSEM